MNLLPIICFWVTVLLVVTLLLRSWGFAGSVIPLIVAANTISIWHGQIEANARQGGIGFECLIWPAVPAAILIFDLWRRGLSPKAKCSTHKAPGEVGNSA
jgi:hypothetical protein